MKKNGAAQHDGNPYGKGSTYHVVMAEGMKGFTSVGEFARATAKKAKDTESAVRFALSVLCRPTHQSNKGRSEVVEAKTAGVTTWTLVALPPARAKAVRAAVERRVAKLAKSKKAHRS